MFLWREVRNENGIVFWEDFDYKNDDKMPVNAEIESYSILGAERVSEFMILFYFSYLICESLSTLKRN
jgi:hypothetical protein